MADVFLNVPILDQKRRCSSQHQRVPLEVGTFEGSSIELLLVLPGSLHRALYQSLMIWPLRLNLRIGRASPRVLLSRIFARFVSFKEPRRHSSHIETSTRGELKCARRLYLVLRRR